MENQQTQIGITPRTARRRSGHSQVLTDGSDVLRRVDTPAATRKPKIALIRQSFRFDGGGERIVARINRQLRLNGYDVTLIARKWNGVQTKVLKCDPPRWTRIQREVRFAQEAIRLTQHHNFDLVQSHERIPGCEVYRAGDGVHHFWLEQRMRTMPSWRVRLLKWNRFHRYLLEAERRMFEHPRLRRVICNSRMIANEISSRFRIAPDKLSVVYNGVDTDHFHPYLKDGREEVCKRCRLPADQPIAIFVGSGWERKGLRQVLTALQQVHGMNLLVVGRDKSERWFRHLTKWLGLDSRVRFLGVQPDVSWFYGAADLFVLPTLYDPFPNSVMEAMASGLPVLTSPKCGGAELITQCENGLVFDALDTKALANSLDYCCDRERCREMGIQARRVIEPCTLEAMQHELSALYNSLLDGRSA